MNSQDAIISTMQTEIVHPGELHFGRAPTIFRTVLGSCVAITVWLPELKVGGLCHYLMVSAATSATRMSGDFRNATLATGELLRLMESYGEKTRYRVSIWGGSQMFGPHCSSKVSQQNIEFARAWVAQNDLKIRHLEVGGHASRTLVFDLNDGCCYLKKFRPEGETVHHDN